jgi:hypothetical protein
VTVATSPQRKRDPKCLMILYWLDTESAYQRKEWAAWGSNPDPRVTVQTPAVTPAYHPALVKADAK